MRVPCPSRMRTAIRAQVSSPKALLNTLLHEDKTRNPDDNTAYNLAVPRHMAFNLMQRDRSRVSLRGKFNLAAWKGGFLAELLSSI